MDKLTEHNEVEHALYIIHKVCSGHPNCEDCPLYYKAYEECIFESAFPQSAYSLFKSGE